jgi:hypothetical protein
MSSYSYKILEVKISVYGVKLREIMYSQISVVNYDPVKKLIIIYKTTCVIYL